MTEDLMQLLRRVAVGEALAIGILLANFKEKKISREEEENIHLYLRQAARQSHDAIYVRALLYDDGYGVKQDVEMAFLLMREAAAKGNSSATYEVGRRFLQGIGVEKSHENALQWLAIAAGSPYYSAEAMYDLGRLYEQGLGVEKDGLLAQTWYAKAAHKGHELAKERLAELKRNHSNE